MNRIALTVLSLLLSVAVAADEFARDKALELVGQARLQVLFWPVYDSRLYSLDGRYEDGQRPLRLEIEYLRDVAAQDLVENTQSEWEELPDVPGYSDQWLAQLAQLWPDVLENDVLCLELDEVGRSTFSINGQQLGGIDDPEFGKYFLDIWLSPATSRPDLRLGLIGGGD